MAVNNEANNEALRLLGQLLPHHKPPFLQVCFERANAQAVARGLSIDNIVPLAMQFALDPDNNDNDNNEDVNDISIDNAIIAITDDNDPDLVNHANANNDPQDQETLAVDSLSFASGLFPDADPDWLEVQLRTAESPRDAVDKIFELNGAYPKRQTGPKRKFELLNDDVAVVNENPAAADVKKPKKLVKRDYTKIDPLYERDAEYFSWCPILLASNFRHCPKTQINAVFLRNGKQLIPAYLALDEIMKDPPFKPKKTMSPLIEFIQTESGILEKEMEALDAIKNGVVGGSENNVADTANEESGDIECGCCYMEWPMEKMTQCEDGHLFCLECARRAAENLIGLRKTALTCLESGGCKYLFPRVEIERFLTPAVLAGYDRLVQEENLRIAEAAKDDVLNVRHKIEEAMTQALLRKCGKIITGYDHFATLPNGSQQPGKMCVLWDNSEERNVKEVEEAAKKATEEAKLLNPDVEDDDIHVEVPVAPPPPAAPTPNFMPAFVPMGNQMVGGGAVQNAAVQIHGRMAQVRLAHQQHQQVHAAEMDRHRQILEALDARRAAAQMRQVQDAHRREQEELARQDAMRKQILDRAQRVQNEVAQGMRIAKQPKRSGR
ncbi:hypothetical protein HK100_005179 [Physocladia obscura]|uniref:E3 ubiquitin-protein ligase RNF216 RING finger HC subclass domain-containing protein n=1 Tax=Physocladia obscura TaxID=109957 RepID=A0AAD5XFJ8_9FUNG|nr:hypothetical protein HK100_005179 [Physocladia obscura]